MAVGIGGGNDTSGGRSGPGGNATKGGANRGGGGSGAGGGGAFGGYGGGSYNNGSGASISRTQRDMGGFLGGGKDAGSTTAADFAQAQKMGLSPDAYGNLAGAYRDQVTDAYHDGFGGLLGRLFGLREQTNYARALAAAQQSTITGNPMDPTASQADWGFDPAGLIGTGLSIATGIPLGGTILDTLSGFAGRPLNINLGANVFGGPASGTNTAAASSGAPGVASTAGMGTGNSWGGYNAQMAARSVGAPAPAASAPGASPTASAGGNYQGMLGQPAYQWNSRFGQGLLGKY